SHGLGALTPIGFRWPYFAYRSPTCCLTLGRVARTTSAVIFPPCSRRPHKDIPIELATLHACPCSMRPPKWHLGHDQPTPPIVLSSSLNLSRPDDFCVLALIDTSLMRSIECGC